MTGARLHLPADRPSHADRRLRDRHPGAGLSGQDGVPRRARLEHHRADPRPWPGRAHRYRRLRGPQAPDRAARASRSQARRRHRPPGDPRASRSLRQLDPGLARPHRDRGAGAGLGGAGALGRDRRARALCAGAAELADRPQGRRRRGGDARHHRPSGARPHARPSHVRAQRARPRGDLHRRCRQEPRRAGVRPCRRQLRRSGERGLDRENLGLLAPPARQCGGARARYSDGAKGWPNAVSWAPAKPPSRRGSATTWRPRRRSR